MRFKVGQFQMSRYGSFYFKRGSVGRNLEPVAELRTIAEAYHKPDRIISEPL